MTHIKTNITTDWDLLLSQLVTERQFFNCSPELSPYIFPIMHFTYNHPCIKQFIYKPIPIGSIAMYIHCGAPIIINNLKDKIKKPKLHNATIQGVHQIDHSMEIYPQGKGEMIVVGFKPGGFAKLFNVPAKAFKNKIVDLTKVLPKPFRNTITEIQSEKQIDQRAKKTIMLLNNLLQKSRFIPVNNHNEVLNLIHKSKGKLSLKEICHQVNPSIRSIQRSFLINIGVSPKDYFRINRINLIMRVLDKLTFENWHQLIHDYGYYDQAHFIHDLKAVTGYTPCEFLQNEHRYRKIQFDRYGIIEYKP